MDGWVGRINGWVGEMGEKLVFVGWVKKDMNNEKRKRKEKSGKKRKKNK